MKPPLDPLGSAEAPLIAGVAIAAMVVGWVVSRLFPSAPLWAEPEWYRTVIRRRVRRAGRFLRRRPVA